MHREEKKVAEASGPPTAETRNPKNPRDAPAPSGLQCQMISSEDALFRQSLRLALGFPRGGGIPLFEIPPDSGPKKRNRFLGMWKPRWVFFEIPPDTAILGNLSLPFFLGPSGSISGEGRVGVLLVVLCGPLETDGWLSFGLMSVPSAPSSHESKSKPGTKMVYPKPCTALRRRPQLFMVGIVPY